MSGGDWSAMFGAPVVVMGCGNILFGDDGLAPLAVSDMAREPGWAGRAAFVDAGTSVRSLLADMLLANAAPKRLVVVDVVREHGRAPGSVAHWDLPRDVPCRCRADGALSLHQAPTRELLAAVRDGLGCDVRVLTVQAARIPEEMDQRLSPEALAALPALKQAIAGLCGPAGS